VVAHDIRSITKTGPANFESFHPVTNSTASHTFIDTGVKCPYISLTHTLHNHNVLLTNPRTFSATLPLDSNVNRIKRQHKGRWKPCVYTWRKFHNVYIRNIFQCCQRSFLGKIKLFLVFNVPLIQLFDYLRVESLWLRALQLVRGFSFLNA
jgi:hypothetical protein